MNIHKLNQKLKYFIKNLKYFIIWKNEKLWKQLKKLKGMKEKCTKCYI